MIALDLSLCSLSCLREMDEDPTVDLSQDRPVRSSEGSADYTTGHIRHHHQFHIPTGDIVIQVEKAIFKVHSHFLTVQSPVFADMFAVPREGPSNADGTDFCPIILAGDPVKGWELLLSAIYRR